jgi:basic membrane protein A
MLKRVETSLLYALRAVQNNTFKGELIVFDLQADGVGYSTTNPAMTPDIVSRLEQYKQRIISGEIRVAATNAAARQLPGFPQNLQARD